jgi:hypothetical protein
MLDRYCFTPISDSNTDHARHQQLRITVDAPVGATTPSRPCRSKLWHTTQWQHHLLLTHSAGTHASCNTCLRTCRQAYSGVQTLPASGSAAVAGNPATQQHPHPVAQLKPLAPGGQAIGSPTVLQTLHATVSKSICVCPTACAARTPPTSHTCTPTRHVHTTQPSTMHQN